MTESLRPPLAHKNYSPHRFNEEGTRASLIRLIQSQEQQLTDLNDKVILGNSLVSQIQ